jgi:hypothetical protein
VRQGTAYTGDAVGATVKINANFSLYGQFGYEFAVAPSIARYNGVKGDIRLRLTFDQPSPLPAPAVDPAAAVARSYLVFFASRMIWRARSVSVALSQSGRAEQLAATSPEEHRHGPHRRPPAAASCAAADARAG